jgi:predicted ATPase
LVALLKSLNHQQLKLVSERVAEVIPGVQHVRVHPEVNQGYYLTDERMIARGGTREFAIPAWLLSEGTRRLTAIHTLLAVEPRPSMIVIEEIENGLDPWTLQGVFRHLRMAADEGVQILATTHSPFLLDHVGVNEILHAQRHEGETTYQSVATLDRVARFQSMVAPGAMYVSGMYGTQQVARKRRSASPDEETPGSNVGDGGEDDGSDGGET